MASMILWLDLCSILSENLHKCDISRKGITIVGSSRQVNVGRNMDHWMRAHKLDQFVLRIICEKCTETQEIAGYFFFFLPLRPENLYKHLSPAKLW